MKDETTYTPYGAHYDTLPCNAALTFCILPRRDMPAPRTESAEVSHAYLGISQGTPAGIRQSPRLHGCTPEGALKQNNCVSSMFARIFPTGHGLLTMTMFSSPIPPQLLTLSYLHQPSGPAPLAPYAPSPSRAALPGSNCGCL